MPNDERWHHDTLSPDVRAEVEAGHMTEAEAGDQQDLRDDPVDPAVPMRIMDRLDDVPPDFRALPALLRYARKWWDADSDRDGEGFNAGDSVWESADLIQAIEQTEQVFPGGPDSHTLPLVLQFATLMERVLADHHDRDFKHTQPCPAGARCDVGPEPHDVVHDDAPMPSWRIGDPREIYGVLINACTTLARTFNDKSNSSVDVGRKAAVVAIYALMLADLGGALGGWPDWQIERAKGSPSAYRPDAS